MKEITKTIIISGSSRGVGFEIAKLFNKNNSKLILVSRNFDKYYLKNFKNSSNIFLIPMLFRS